MSTPLEESLALKTSLENEYATFKRDSAKELEELEEQKKKLEDELEALHRVINPSSSSHSFYPAEDVRFLFI